MSVRVHVRQFFDDEGLAAFGAIFEDHRRLASAFPGFISLKHSALTDRDRKNEVHVTLEFEDEVLFQQWRSSLEHEQIAARYSRHWTREPDTAFYSVESGR